MNGLLAQRFGGVDLPLKVLVSAGGYYIGTEEEGMPYSRESVEYWPTQVDAENALENGDWTQRPNP